MVKLLRRSYFYTQTDNIQTTTDFPKSKREKKKKQIKSPYCDVLKIEKLFSRLCFIPYFFAHFNFIESKECALKDDT
jgi:hypothetical protein